MNGARARLDWDSKLFAFEVASWRPRRPSIDAARDMLHRARCEKFRLVYWFAPPDETAQECARAIWARLVDRKVTYLAPTEGRSSAFSASIWPTKQKTDQLLSLALQSGEYSRFCVDWQLPPRSYERLYSAWLDQSLAGAVAREVLVFHGEEGEEKDELGFLTLGVKNQRLDIGLLAVDSRTRGRGIGKALVEAAFQRAQTWGFDQVQVVTQQDNARACRFYESIGFSEVLVEHVYHIWV